MMQRPWLNQYPQSVSHHINPDEYPSAVALMERSCAKYSDYIAFENMGTQLSYVELDRQSRHFAAYLQKVLGLKKGDRIALQMPNLLQYPVALFGALRAGLIVVNTNPLYTPREMRHQFVDSGVRAVVILANFASSLEKILADTKIEHVLVTEIGDMLKFPKNYVVNAVVKHVRKMVPKYEIPTAIGFMDALRIGSALRLDPVAIHGEDIAFLQYTGGTTGVAKGAMLTHRNMVANMLQISAVITPSLREKSEVVITPLPLYHIFSLTVNCMAMMRIGAHNVLITNPKDIPTFIKQIAGHRFTVITGVNTLFNALMNHKDFSKLNFKSLKIACGGGMAVQKAVAERWKQLTGHPLVEGYGLTESSPVLSVNPVDTGGKIGTIGLPLPSTDMKIVKDDGSDGAQGEVGEIWATGPQIMRGYWQRPDETEKVLKDGWLATGDVGLMHADGYFQIVDRKKDMILVSGFNVYPNEVEDAVAMHAGVAEVAAIGIPDDKSGEAVKIFVVKKDPALTEEQLRDHCKKQLTGYKLPRFVEFRTELPKTNVGKILRRELRDEELKKIPQ